MLNNQRVYSTPISNHSPANDLLIQMSRACTAGSWYPNTQAEHWNLGWTCWKRCSIAMVDHRRVSHHDSNSKKNGKVYSSSQENSIYIYICVCVCVCVFKFCYRYQEEVGWASHVFCGCGWEMLRTMLHPSWYVVKDNLSLPPPIDVIVFWTENPMGFSTSMLLLLLG